MKKVLSLLLVAAMLVCMMPAMAFAADEEATAPKFYAEVASGETKAYVSVGADYNIKGALYSTTDAFNVNTTDVSGMIQMTDVASLGITGTRTHEVSYDLSAYLPELEVSLAEYMGEMMERDGSGDVTLNVAGQAPVKYTFNVADPAQAADGGWEKTVTGTVNDVNNARIVWAEMASHVTAGEGERGSSAGVITEGSYIVAGEDTLTFIDDATIDPNGAEGIVAAVEEIQRAAELTDGGEGLKAYLKAGSTVQVGDSQAVLKDDAIIEVTAPGITVPAGILEDFRAAVNDEEGNRAVTLVTMVVGMANELAGAVTSGVEINVEFVEQGGEGGEGGSDIFFPVYVAPVDPLAEERAEANAAVDLVEVADAAEYTEVADEIKAIADKAAADIAAAKTAEEIAAIEAEAKAAIEEIKLVFDVEETGLVARSEFTKSPKGKDAILITWYDKEDRDVEFEGVEIYRSTKRNSGFKKIFTSKTDKYYNTAIEEGVKYFYRVRGYVTVDGEKVYTDLSLRAIRTAK